MATRDDIKNVIAYLGMAFPNYHPDVESPLNTVDVMFDLLGDLPADALQMAVRSCCSEAGRTFAPSTGEIRGAISLIRAKVSGVPTAGEAWSEIVGSFERMPSGNMSGGGHTPILDHPLVKKAVACMGGYTEIGVDFYENQMANRAHFIKFYNELLDNWKSEATELPQLTQYVQKQIEGSVKMLTDKETV
jgi:hypothetical protein